MVIQFKEVEKPKRGRPKSGMPAKILLTLRLDPEVVSAFRAAGDGWQSRMNEALRNHLGLGGQK